MVNSCLGLAGLVLHSYCQAGHPLLSFGQDQTNLAIATAAVTIFEPAPTAAPGAERRFRRRRSHDPSPVHGRIGTVSTACLMLAALWSRMMRLKAPTNHRPPERCDRIQQQSHSGSNPFQMSFGSGHGRQFRINIIEPHARVSPALMVFA